MIETNRIELKRELTRELDLEREVVAFLNYREGGIIYIGIDDNGSPVGVKDIDGDMLKIKRLLFILEALFWQLYLSCIYSFITSSYSSSLYNFSSFVFSSLFKRIVLLLIDNE